MTTVGEEKEQFNCEFLPGFIPSQMSNSPTIEKSKSPTSGQPGYTAVASDVADEGLQLKPTISLFNGVRHDHLYDCDQQSNGCACR